MITYNNAGTDSTTIGDKNKNIGERKARSDCGKGIFSNVLANNCWVNKIVELLKEISKNNWYYKNCQSR